MRRVNHFLLVMLVVLFVGSAAGAQNDDKVVDQADLLTDAEEERLETQLLEIAETYQCDVAVLTTDSLDGKTATAYTDDYYYEHGYGYGLENSGIMLMVSVEERDWWIATRGNAITIFTDYGLRTIRDMFLEKLSDGDYYEAFHTFGNAAADFMEEAANNRPYDTNHEYHVPMGIGLRIVISLGVGLVGALLVFAVLFAQLKSVGRERMAFNYIRDGSFHLTRSNDLFLYRTMSRRKIEKDTSSGGGSSTHSTSDGGSAGGIGGKF